MAQTYNKKGQVIGEGWALFTVTVFMVMILVAFFFVTRAFMETADNVKSADDFSMENSAKASLVSYLATPISVQFDGKEVNMTMVNLIELARVNSDYKSVWEGESKGMLDRVYGDKYRLELTGFSLVGRPLYFPVEKVESTTPPFREVSYRILIPENLTLELTLIK
jgi:hypothetical protein